MCIKEVKHRNRQNQRRWEVRLHANLDLNCRSVRTLLAPCLWFTYGARCWALARKLTHRFRPPCSMLTSRAWNSTRTRRTWPISHKQLARHLTHTVRALAPTEDSAKYRSIKLMTMVNGQGKLVATIVILKDSKVKEPALWNVKYT